MNIRRAKKKFKKKCKALGIDATMVLCYVVPYSKKTKIRFYAPYDGKIDKYFSGK